MGLLMGPDHFRCLLRVWNLDLKSCAANRKYRAVKKSAKKKKARGKAAKTKATKKRH